MSDLIATGNLVYNIASAYFVNSSALLVKRSNKHFLHPQVVLELYLFIPLDDPSLECLLKRTWSIINEITSRKQTSSLVKQVKCDDKTIIDPNQICEVFNEHFASIGPKLAEEIPADVTGHSHFDYLTNQNYEHSFQFQETNTSAVFCLLSKLCKSKATGLDRTSAKLLRVCPDLIAESLCAIFNRSINTGIFPHDWKCSKVIPLFKNGERLDLNNYRPISVVSCQLSLKFSRG